MHTTDSSNCRWRYTIPERKLTTPAERRKIRKGFKVKVDFSENTHSRNPDSNDKQNNTTTALVYPCSYFEIQNEGCRYSTPLVLHIRRESHGTIPSAPTTLEKDTYISLSRHRLTFFDTRHSALHQKRKSAVAGRWWAHGPLFYRRPTTMIQKDNGHDTGARIRYDSIFTHTLYTETVMNQVPKTSAP